MTLASCANLKGINTFAGNSSKVLAQPFPYSYAQYCYDSSYVYDTTAAFVSYPCNCQHAIDHDTAVARESGKLIRYFIAVSKLSGSSDIINVDTLAGAVTAGKYGSLTITSTDATVASAVATAIQDLITVNFKSKHLAIDLRQYGGAVDSSLNAYIRHLDNVSNKLLDMHDKLVFRLHIYRETAAPGPNRWAILYAYNQMIADLTTRQRQFDTLIRQIRLIREGYRQLILNAGSIHSKSLKQKLMALVQNISYLSKSQN
jgi:hypothetical protein